MTKSLKKKSEILTETREWIWVRRLSDTNSDPFTDGEKEAIFRSAEMIGPSTDEMIGEATLPPRQ
ncbi:MAG: hypothetical protein WBO10_11525 [Pyrinomonadaceae bacterium]